MKELFEKYPIKDILLVMLMIAVYGYIAFMFGARAENKRSQQNLQIAYGNGEYHMFNMLFACYAKQGLILQNPYEQFKSSEVKK